MHTLAFRFPLSLSLLLGLSSVAIGQSPQHVAPTDPLSPAEQRELFHLPPGFEIQLVLADPVIGQPMNLNFDAAGRLWVTHSVEYPYPAAGKHVEPRDPRFGPPGDHPPRDRVTIAQGLQADGTPAKVWNLADGLNIPIGVVPTPGGAIVYSIPHIVHYTDPDGDGSADGQEVLFGPFGNVDTHGMNNGFTRWIDGWIYACHGFRNTSEVSGTDGNVVSMNSGNTYRFREDGSRIEQFTWGQVNPFGLTFDPWGNLYSADCHSKPLTLLLRGAYYSSFGKPHDGLGFGPDMIDHSHGSTGICGPAYYAGEKFPEEYRDCLYLCNPVTGRVHRDRLIEHGSTRLVDSQPDFITCDDPWFRPVDVKLGPDGALYLADFYNAVIGHYEVPLEHPKRDRVRGRVWRIVYVGEEERSPIAQLPDLTQLDLPQVIERLGDTNLTVRMLATNELADRVDTRRSVPSEWVDAVRAALADASSPVTPEFRVHAMWVLFRWGALFTSELTPWMTDDSPLVRTHLAKALAEKPEWTTQEAEFARAMLLDENAFVHRAAADALGQHPSAEHVAPLLDSLLRANEQDTHLRHTIRIALKNHFLDEEILRTLDVDGASRNVQVQLASILLAVPNPAAADLLAAVLAEEATFPEWGAAIVHIARHASPTALETFLHELRDRTRDDWQRQIQVLTRVHDGLESRRQHDLSLLQAWAGALTLELLDRAEGTLEWTETPVAGLPHPRAAWTQQARTATDGQVSLYYSTLPSGEQGTGVYRSSAFSLPEEFSFYMAGHCGFPDQPCHGKNRIVLRDARTRRVLRRADAPRHDTARQVNWDLHDIAGDRAYVELVDADTAGAYAWLAAGRFSVNALNPQKGDAANAVVELVRMFHLQDLTERLAPRLSDPQAPLTGRQIIANMFAHQKQDARLQTLALIAGLPSVPQKLRETIYTAIASGTDETLEESLPAGMNLLSEREQAPVMQLLASDQRGARALMQMAEQGQISPRILTQPAIEQRLSALLPNVGQQIAALTADLPAQDEAALTRIRSATEAFAWESASAERGAEIFKKHCAICHKIGNEGTVIGPQLDGIGRRGLERLLEDILDPNRNVDAAFRSTTMVLVDGRVKTGLLRRNEGQNVVFADQQGKEFAVSKAEIEQQKVSVLSLMPANVGEGVGPEGLNDLLAFLLTKS